jgi:hypothetical protein
LAELRHAPSLALVQPALAETEVLLKQTAARTDLVGAHFCYGLFE